MSRTIIEVYLLQIRNVIIYGIEKQNNLKENTTHYRGNNFTIKSMDFPELGPALAYDTIYLRGGSSKSDYNFSARYFNSIEEASKFKKEVLKTFEEWLGKCVNIGASSQGYCIYRFEKDLNKRKIVIDNKEIEISEESYLELKKSLEV
jgi:hypothetical protein